MSNSIPDLIVDVLVTTLIVVLFGFILHEKQRNYDICIEAKAKGYQLEQCGE